MRSYTKNIEITRGFSETMYSPYHQSESLLPLYFVILKIGTCKSLNFVTADLTQ